MRFQPLIILFPLLLSIAGCQTMTPEERRAADERTCTGYGFRTRTDAMARCLLDLELDRRAQRRALSYSNDMMLWPPVVVERHVIVHRP